MSDKLAGQAADGDDQGHERADAGGKWWRWESHAGRWMPSEPPGGDADATHWRVSRTPPPAPVAVPRMRPEAAEQR